MNVTVPVSARTLHVGDEVRDVVLRRVQREPPIHKACSRSPLAMTIEMIASQKRAARMRFTRGFMVFEMLP